MMKKSTNQKVFNISIIFCFMVPIIERNIQAVKYIGAFMFLILFIGVGLSLISLTMSAVLYRDFVKLYETIKTEEKERYKSYFIVNSEQREESVKKWNALLQENGNQLVENAERTLRSGDLTKKQETKIREMVRKTRKILTTE